MKKPLDFYMIRYALNFFRYFLLLLSLMPFLAQAEDAVLKTLSARVVKVEADGSSLDVDFRHPATDKTHRLVFFMDNRSGLSGIKTLKELRTGQVVNIDYVEGSKDRLCIRRLERVRLSGPPPGLEKFRGL